VNIQEYIESGVLETYILGSASESEVRELFHLKEQYPQIQNTLQELEMDMEFIASRMAITPPPEIWIRINDGINELTTTNPNALLLTSNSSKDEDFADKKDNYIEVEGETTHMRVHKTWKWVFAAVFILSKIFLIASIYFYLENRQAQQQIKQLQLELKQAHR
jgi:hypothetical protein